MSKLREDVRRINGWVKFVEDKLQALTNTVSRNDKAHYEQMSKVAFNWNDVLRTERDKWKHEYHVLNEEVMAQRDMINKLLKIVKVSGILEVAETGDDLFQFHSTVDILQRNPLYKINKVKTL